MSPNLPHHRNRWTDPDASPELGSSVFLGCLVLAVIAVFLLIGFGLWIKS